MSDTIKFMNFPPLGPTGGYKGPLLLDGWDLCQLGAFLLPGMSRITQGGVKLKEDKKSKAGAHGSNPTYHGIDPQQFTLKVRGWTDDQLDLFGNICRQILPRTSLLSQPLAIVHPSLFHLGDVVNVQIIGGGVIEIQDGSTWWHCDMHMRHWLPVVASKGKSATTTPTRAIRNKRREDAESREPSNPAPMSTPGAGDPPVLQSLP